MLVKLNWYSRKKASLVFNAIFLVFIISYAGLLYQLGRPVPQDKKIVKLPPAPIKEKLFFIENLIGHGDTIVGLLKKEGVDPQVAYGLFMDVKTVYNLKGICAGKKYTLGFSEDRKELKQFKYEIDPARSLIVYKNEKDEKDKKETGYKAVIKTVPYEVKEEYVAGEIDESLFASILAAGEKPELADLMASLYEYDIDFNRDIQKKDSFSLLVEKMYLDNRFIKYGNILAAEFTNRGKTVPVIRYTDEEGKTAYYTPDGRSVKKMFLRCPLPFMHVTSSYGNRMHPLLGFSAQHNGIDLSAPLGTPVKATASGITRSLGYDHAKGNFVCIEHSNHYITHYYHFSKIEKNLKVGNRVEQGEIIGYVGSTGWSTGPHLHYGLQKSGKFSNPLRLNSPSVEPLKEVYLQDFKSYTSRVFLIMSGSKYVRIPSILTQGLLKPQISKPLLPGTGFSTGR